MAHLTQLWNDKLKNIRQQGRDNTNEHGLEKKLRVTWDDPNFGQGEKVHEELFATYEEALDYAIGIGIKYDLRKRNGKFHSVDPELSRFKSGFSPIPESSAIPTLWPSLLNYGAMPEGIGEGAIRDYCERHGISREDRPQWTLPVEERADQIALNARKARVKAGPL